MLRDPASGRGGQFTQPRKKPFLGTLWYTAIAKQDVTQGSVV